MVEYASKDAAAALARAQELSATVRDGTKWYVRYLVIFGCASAAQALAVGLLVHPYGMAIGTGIGGVTVTALSVYAVRQRVSRRGFGWWHAGLMGVWTLLYVGVLLLGFGYFPGAVAWWVPGALVVALPGLIGSYLEARR
ncbi:hypothetical protein ACFVJH_30365 [Streptomyces decoyicus]|uniref:hypothetical protein n=1 Tax=Streptomyces decoyicus TaxID=249567 RepID=UPI003627EE95